MLSNEQGVPVTPKPVMGLFDKEMWQSINRGEMALQRCCDCGKFRYPPGPACDKCLSMSYEWAPLAGGGSILSWVVFHRSYLPAYPAPYNVIAVRLDEGPVFVSNLEGKPPSESWISARVRLVYSKMADGVVLPRFVLDG